MLTKEQFLELRRKGLSIEQIRRFESGQTPRVTQQTAGNQFAQDKVVGELPGNRAGTGNTKLPSLLTRGVDFIFGGGKLAQGAGQALAAPKLQAELQKAEQGQSDTLLALRKQIQKRQGEGADTSRLEAAARNLMEDMKISRDAQEDFVNSLKTSKEVVGSATRLATSVAAPVLGKGLVQATGATKAVGAVNAGLRYGAAGAVGGALVGGVTEGAREIEQGGDATSAWDSAKTGAMFGGALGGALGAAGGAVAGHLRGRASAPIRKITPPSDAFPEGEWEELVKRGLVTPKTSTRAAKYNLPKPLAETATKYSSQIKNDPVKTVNNLRTTGKGLDKEVETMLGKTNPIFNRGELKKALLSALDDVDDIGVDEKRLTKMKSQIVSDFVDSVEGGDVKSLWAARKSFDTFLQNKGVFGNNPSLNNQVKRAVRDATQEFVKAKLPPEQAAFYAEHMKEMSSLYKLEELASMIAGKERGSSGLVAFSKSHPTLKYILATLGITGLSSYLWNNYFGGHTSSGG